ncbi:MAG: hypothetical protein AAB938_00045 [Patescibacteria group bacterium]
MDTDRKRIFARLTALLYVIAALHITALYFFWYWSMWWYDILMHTLSGLWIAGMVLFIISGKRFGALFSPLVRFGFPLLVVVCVGIAWETFEWNVDQIILSHFQNDIVDTLSDIGADVAGGLVASLLLLGYRYEERADIPHD